MTKYYWPRRRKKIPQKPGRKRTRPKASFSHLDQVGPKILRELAFSEKTQTQIATEFNVSRETVGLINKRYGIRPKAVTEAIQYLAVSRKSIGRVRPSSKKKTNLFSLTISNEVAANRLFSGQLGANHSISNIQSNGGDVFYR